MKSHLLDGYFTEGNQLLRTWSARYSKREYPEKILLNTYYKQLSIYNMWTFLEDCFSNNRSEKMKIFYSINDSLQFLELEYNKYSKETHPTVKAAMEDDSLSHQIRLFKDHYKSLVSTANSGNEASLKELELTFIKYFITNKLILLWAAGGLIGKTKMRAYQELANIITGNYYPEFEEKTINMPNYKTRYSNTFFYLNTHVTFYLSWMHGN